jgi:hypothetical protein
MNWNHRLLRITVGLFLVGIVVVALLPGMTGYTSLDGTVNARFAIINAPIDGTIAQATPKVGTLLAEGMPLLIIHNERVNRAVFASLSAERNTALDSITALRRERDELAQLRDELSTRLNIYKEATIASILQDLSILRERVESSEAQNVAAQADLVRRRQLGLQGIASASIIELARAAGITTTGLVTINNMSSSLSRSWQLYAKAFSSQETARTTYPIRANGRTKSLCASAISIRAYRKMKPGLHKLRDKWLRKKTALRASKRQRYQFPSMALSGAAV